MESGEEDPVVPLERDPFDDPVRDSFPELAASELDIGLLLDREYQEASQLDQGCEAV